MRELSHWQEKYFPGEALDILCDLAETAALSSGCDRGRFLAKLIRKGDLAAVVDFKIDYSVGTPHEIQRLRQALAYFQKYESLDVGHNKKLNAKIADFLAEERCASTNDLFRQWHAGSVSFRPKVCAVLHLAASHISRILGPMPGLSRLGLRYGPGASTVTPKRSASIKRKLGGEISCSVDLLPWAGMLLAHLPALVESHAIQNRIDELGDEWSSVNVLLQTEHTSYVLKNCKTLRSTKTQPTLNGMLQLALGDYMSDRCGTVPGLNLKDQSLNQRLACLGSLTDQICTLDLRSASNTVAYQLVWSMFPEEWAAVLSLARCGTAVENGVECKLEMFSAMGNGFTFPLESLLFWTLVRACATVSGVRSPIVSVFGDDIICDVSYVDLVKEVLDVCGFWLNAEKSFIRGRFRESCGADYLEGIDVRPVYVKKDLTPAVLCILHNGLIRKGMPDLAKDVLRFIPRRLHWFGPDRFGDGHLVDLDWTPSRSEVACLSKNARARKRGWEGSYFLTHQDVAKRDFVPNMRGDSLLASYSIDRRASVRVLPIPDTALPASFIGKWMRGTGRVEEVPEPLPGGNDWDVEVVDGPEGSDTMTITIVDGPYTKYTTFPGTDGCRVKAIYAPRL